MSAKVKAEKAAAMERMAAARRTGVRVTDERQFEDASMFEEVTDEQYRKIVQERRKQKAFVVGKGERCCSAAGPLRRGQEAQACYSAPHCALLSESALLSTWPFRPHPSLIPSPPPPSLCRHSGL